MVGQSLQPGEIEYFINLYRMYGITYLSIDKEGFTFKEGELPQFLISEESPEIGLQKMLRLRKITNEIYNRLRCCYTLQMTDAGGEVEVSLINLIN